MNLKGFVVKLRYDYDLLYQVIFQARTKMTLFYIFLISLSYNLK